jgi:hypothetical protein
MLYTLFVFTFGVYVGQEYNDVPNVRATVNRAMRYLKDPDGNNTGGSAGGPGNGSSSGVAGAESVPKSVVDFWKSFFEKPKND